MVKAKVYITVKKSVSDPQGTTVKHALESLGFKGVSNVRMGKYIELYLNSKSKKTASTEVDRMCKKLLANPIIEEYRYEVK